MGTFCQCCLKKDQQGYITPSLSYSSSEIRFLFYMNIKWKLLKKPDLEHKRCTCQSLHGHTKNWGTLWNKMFQWVFLELPNTCKYHSGLARANQPQWAVEYIPTSDICVQRVNKDLQHPRLSQKRGGTWWYPTLETPHLWLEKTKYCYCHNIDHKLHLTVMHMCAVVLWLDPWISFISSNC